MKTYQAPTISIITVQASQILASSTFESVNEGDATTVTYGGTIGDGESFNTKGSVIEWEGWE